MSIHNHSAMAATTPSILKRTPTHTINNHMSPVRTIRVPTKGMVHSQTITGKMTMTGGQ